MGFPRPVDARLTAPLVLPAEPGKPLTTQGGNTLDDGSGDATIGRPGGWQATIGNYESGVSISYNGVPQSGFGGGAQTFGGDSINAYVNSAGGGTIYLRPGGSTAESTQVYNNGDLSAYGSIQPNNAAKINSGTGAPTIAGTAGDFFFRTDTPSTSLQRIYVCTVTGSPGTWVGIV